MRILALVSVLLFACASSPAPRPEAAAEKPPLGKLPPDVRPTHYALSLLIVPERDRFSGEAEIAIELDKARSVIWLHGSDLRVTSASVEAAGERVEAAYEQVNPDGVARISLPRAVGPGQAVLRFVWDAPFNPHVRGLYRSRAEGRVYASTQFEEISARNAFPSFDEPRFKTPFEITLTGPEGDALISNAPTVEETRLENGMKRARFAPTAPLPTYLVLFAVGPWDEVPVEVPPNEVRKRPLPMRFFAPRGRARELDFAKSAAPPLLALLERYFASEMPFAKLDHIVVPDFEQGAMENAGAITYRERFLLYDEGKSPPEVRNDIVDGLAHEMAHQWFGDAVTMPWWDEIWLNESFASWLAARIVDSWDPSFGDGVDLFKRSAGAMNTDSLRTARRIRQPIENTGDIQNAFDALTYWKGGELLAMFERFLGPEAFRAGIRAYVEGRKHGLGSTDALLDAVGRAAGRDVTAAFHSFLDQEGVPLVEGKVTCAGSSASLDLTQSRYLPLGSQASRERVWQVPVCARYLSDGRARESCTLLTEARGSLPLEGGCPEWVMPNADGQGYYRWSLAPADLEKLRSAGYSKLSVRERISMALALQAAVRSGSLPAAAALAALPPVAADMEGAVAAEPIGFLRFVIQELASGAEKESARRYATELYGPVAKRLGWSARKGESQEDRRLREATIGFLSFTGGDAEVRAEAVKRGRAYAGERGAPFRESAVEPGLAFVALAAAVQEGDATFFDSLEERLGKIDEENARTRVISALSFALDPALADRALALTFDPRLRANERLAPLFVMSTLPQMREHAWRWTQAHVDQLEAALGDRYFSPLPNLGGAFCDGARARELKALFESRTAKHQGLARPLANTLERIDLCRAQVEAQRASAEQFLRSRKIAGR